MKQAGDTLCQLTHAFPSAPPSQDPRDPRPDGLSELEKQSPARALPMETPCFLPQALPAGPGAARDGIHAFGGPGNGRCAGSSHSPSGLSAFPTASRGPAAHTGQLPWAFLMSLPLGTPGHLAVASGARGGG